MYAPASKRRKSTEATADCQTETTVHKRARQKRAYVPEPGNDGERGARGRQERKERGELGRAGRTLGTAAPCGTLRRDSRNPGEASGPPLVASRTTSLVLGPPSQQSGVIRVRDLACLPLCCLGDPFQAQRLLAQPPR